jgi:outer membrane protein assembly factor BamB
MVHDRYGMQSRGRWSGMAWLIACMGGWLVNSAAADWNYRGNRQRTAYSEQQVPAVGWAATGDAATGDAATGDAATGDAAAWSSARLTPPEPTWPAPARGSLWQNLDRLQPRQTADAGLVPIIATSSRGDALVLVASATDHRLVAWEAASGQLRWVLQLEAPIRFAPETHQGVAYFGADDGLVRAVSLDDGRVLWSTRIGPDLPWIYGNSSLISPHPIRTSVLLADLLPDGETVSRPVDGKRGEPKLIAHAGLFPSQGVYSAALNLDDGRLLWRKRIEQSPQGYLLSEPNGRRFFVPTGRAKPFMAALDDGEVLGELPSPGGDFCIVTEEAYFTGPGNAQELVAYAAESSTEMLTLGGSAVAVGGGMIWTANGRQLQCQRLQELSKARAVPVWQVDCELAADLIVSPTPVGACVWIAGGTQVQVYHALDGRLLEQWGLPPADVTHAFPEQISRLALSPIEGGGLLVATTNYGRVVAWSSGRPDGTAAAANSRTKIDPTEIDPTLISSTSVEQLVRGDAAQIAALTADVQVLLQAALPAGGRGLVCVLGGSAFESEQSQWVRWLLEHSQVQIVWVQAPQASAQQANAEAIPPRYSSALSRLHGQYAHRLAVWQRSSAQGLHIAPGLFNAVVKGEGGPWSDEELLTVLAPGAGKLLHIEARRLQTRDALRGAGVWRHQYASPANTSSTDDQLVGKANYFRLQWFGGVGPSRIPDRHLRGPAPLAAGSNLVIHGDGQLIGVDPANGIERWQLDLPFSAMRYVMPYDAAHTCLSADGERLLVAAADEIWTIDAATGGRLERRGLPPDAAAAGYQWGYLAELSGTLLASCMKTSAPRLSLERAEARSSYSDQDYRSERPLVCSRLLYSLANDGSVNWRYEPQGPMVHGTISVEEMGGRIVLVEGRSPASRQHATDRIPLAVLLEDAYLVCLDQASGEVLWEQRLVWPEARNVLYTQVAQQRLVLVSSRSVGEAAEYLVRVLELDSGELIWQTEHQHVRSGLYHGEQVHHPVLLQRDAHTAWLIAEPFIYDLHTGQRRTPAGADGDWSLQRPGHSCGTITGAGSCLFFRANNPTVLDLETLGEARFIKLAPTRPSCWINMIPACGQLIIPEGSASCVCAYPLQTSLAFVPQIGEESSGLQLLPDIAAD